MAKNQFFMSRTKEWAVTKINPLLLLIACLTVRQHRPVCVLSKLLELDFKTKSFSYKTDERNECRN
jgi:hypothetical protein